MNKLVRKLAKVLKKVLGEGFYRRTDVLGHTLEAWTAAALNGFPGKRLKIIGVTGTNGKTTSINYIASVLMSAGYKVGVSTTANFKIGDLSWDNELNATVTDPWNLQKLLRKMKKEKVDWVVLEVTSHALYQNRVGGVDFEIAVMTNLSPDHLDYHGTKDVDSYAASKAKLFKKAKVAAVLNRDDDWYDYFRKSAYHAVYSYGTNREADVRLEKASIRSDHSRIKFRYGERMMELDLKLPGKFNVYNALAAAAVAFGLEAQWEDVRNGLESLSGVPGRMEAIHAGQDFAVVVDYAHTGDAFESVLGNMKAATKGRVITVFGGAPTHDYKVLGSVAGRLSDLVIVTDDEPMDEDPDEVRSQIVSEANSSGGAEVREIQDRRQALKTAFSEASSDDSVAILGLGHQKYRRVEGGKKIEWDDRAVAKELLESMTKESK